MRGQPWPLVGSRQQRLALHFLIQNGGPDRELHPAFEKCTTAQPATSDSVDMFKREGGLTVGGNSYSHDRAITEARLAAVARVVGNLRELIVSSFLFCGGWNGGIARC